MSDADTNNKTEVLKGASSDPSATSAGPASGCPSDATATSEPQSSVDKAVLQVPTDLEPTSPTTSPGSPDDPSSAAEPAQPCSHQSAEDDETVNSDDAIENSPFYDAAIKLEIDTQLVWEYCQANLHKLGAEIDPTIKLEEDDDQMWALLLSPVPYRMQEYFNERAYVRQIKRVIRERLSMGESGEQKDKLDEAVLKHHVRAEKLLTQTMKFMRDMVEREQGFGRYLRELECFGHAVGPKFPVWDSAFDGEEDDGHGGEEGNDDHEAAAE